MGTGGFGTNASMHWRISHSDSPGSVPVMGRDPIPVNLIGEGSDGNGQPIENGKGHRGFLRVEMRFTASEGQRSLRRLADIFTNDQRLRDFLAQQNPADFYLLSADVPIVDRTLEDIDARRKEPWEVKVDW